MIIDRIQSQFTRVAGGLGHNFDAYSRIADEI